MAKGIIEAVARAGYEVVYVTRGEEKVAAVRTEIERSLDKAVLRGRLTQSERDAALGLIRGSHRMDDLAAADLVIEAAVEELSVKQALFETFDEICKPGAVLATTTSSLPVIEMAAATKRPSDVIGLHFFNPAQTMQLVEVVRTVHSSAEALATGVALVRGLDKTPVVCGDRAGFIVNTLLFPYLNDAVKMLEAHYASADDMDTAMKVGCGYPMGPFELLDVVGLDVAAAIQIQLYREFREPGFAPAPLLEHLVTAGYLGHKSGRGFRVHD
jgi:3-hydroxybutyryl-CoA dehydrogenase